MSQVRTKNFKFFLEQFNRQKQYLTEKKLTIELDYNKEFNYIEFLIIGNYEQEKNICLFSTKQNKLINEILKYLLNSEYEIILSVFDPEYYI